MSLNRGLLVAGTGAAATFAATGTVIALTMLVPLAGTRTIKSIARDCVNQVEAEG